MGFVRNEEEKKKISLDFVWALRHWLKIPFIIVRFWWASSSSQGQENILREKFTRVIFEASHYAICTTTTEDRRVEHGIWPCHFLTLIAMFDNARKFWPIQRWSSVKMKSHFCNLHILIFFGQSFSPVIMHHLYLYCSLTHSFFSSADPFCPESSNEKWEFPGRPFLARLSAPRFFFFFCHFGPICRRRPKKLFLSRRSS